MQIISEVFTADNVHVRLVKVLPGEAATLQRHEDQNVVSIPLSNLQSGMPFEMFRAFLLNYARPNEYYALNANGDREENFIQFIWNAK